MKFSHSFIVSQKLQESWNFFQNIETLVECMPGASLKEDCGNGKYVGSISIGLGPFTATFDGEATHEPNKETKTGSLKGKAIDKKGGSRTSLSLAYNLKENNGVTLVTLDADIQLSGPIAQFGRVGVIEETAKLIIGEFVSNAEKRMLENSDQLKKAKETNSSDTTRNSSSKTDDIAIQNAKSVNSLSLLKIVRVLILQYIKRIFGNKSM